MNKPEFFGDSRTKSPFSSRYENFIGGQWVAPSAGRYFENTSPITGKVVCEVPRSDATDVDKALDAAHAAKEAWGRTAPAERARILNKMADRMEENLDLLALAETWDNGKPIRETTHADIPLAIDHFRYFAGCVRAQEGSISEIDHDTVAYHFHEPLGVVGQIIPWNFPILMAVWKLAPALAAGNCVVLKPAEQTPASASLGRPSTKDKSFRDKSWPVPPGAAKARRQGWAHWPRLPLRPPKAALSRHWPLTLMHRAPWTKASSSTSVPARMAAISFKDSSRASTTRAMPSSSASRTPAGEWRLIWVEAWRGSSGARCRSRASRPMS